MTAVMTVQVENAPSHGSSLVPIGVHGPQRARRCALFQPPAINPSRAMTTSA